MKNIENYEYWQKGTAFLGTKYPIISGAMTWISDSRLVKAMGDAGGLGVLAAGNMPIDVLESEIDVLQKANVHFAVNLITIAPNYLDHLALVAKKKVPIVVFAGSFPRKKEIVVAKVSGAKVMCFASTESIAERMVNYGADALILEGSEAGGHIGHVSTMVLIQQVLFKFRNIPIFVAGGIATGKMMAHLFLMGVYGVQMGTIFAMSTESPAHQRFKDRYKRARAREAFATPQYDSALPVVAVRALKNKGMEAFGDLQLKLLDELKAEKINRVEAQYEVEGYWAGALRKAVQEGDIEFGSLMAGQSVGLVNDVKPVADIIGELVRECEDTFNEVKQLVNR